MQFLGDVIVNVAVLLILIEDPIDQCPLQLYSLYFVVVTSLCSI